MFLFQNLIRFIDYYLLKMRQRSADQVSLSLILAEFVGGPANISALVLWMGVEDVERHVAVLMDDPHPASTSLQLLVVPVPTDREVQVVFGLNSTFEHGWLALRNKHLPENIKKSLV